MFSLIQLPNLRWIPKAFSLSPSPQRPSTTSSTTQLENLEDTQLEKDTIIVQENVRIFFILIRSSLSIISFRKTFICHPLRVFEMLSQNSYLNATSLTIKRHTTRIFTIYAFKNANSKNTPSTKSMEKLRSQSTFLVVLSSPLQDTLILKIDRLKCSSPFTQRFSLG